MAICAICQHDLHREQGIVLAGSEAFHRACVRAHGTASSVVNRLKQKLLEVEAAAVRDRDELRMKLDEATEVLRKSGRKVAELTAELEAARLLDVQLGLKKAELAGVRTELRALHGQVSNLEREADELGRERDVARREAALHQLLAQSAPVKVAPAPETIDDRDPTVVRFSLLEIDDKK